MLSILEKPFFCTIIKEYTIFIWMILADAATIIVINVAKVILGWL